MKKLVQLLIGISLIYCSGCRLSTEELAVKLKPNIESKIQTSFNKSFVADKLVIALANGNNYEGIIEGKINDNPISYKVKIVYDGNNAYYEIKPNINSMFN